MGHKYLLLWLEGPLQSWGFESLFGRRETLGFPTLSGVMGLLCAACGRAGTQRDFLADFSDVPWSAHSFQMKNEDDELIRPSRMEDFHMVGGGYDITNPWQKLMVPKTSEQKNAVGGGSKITFRYYLENAAFAVVIGLPDPHEEEVVCALQAPQWSLHLGRKCCVPTEIVFQGIFVSEDMAMTKAVDLGKQKGRSLAFSAYNDARDCDEMISLRDVPVQFGVNKEYVNRNLSIIYVER